MKPQVQRHFAKKRAEVCFDFFFVQWTDYMCRRCGQNLYAIETTKVSWNLCCLNVANGEFYTFLSKKWCYVVMEIWIWLRKKILLCMLKLIPGPPSFKKSIVCTCKIFALYFNASRFGCSFCLRFMPSKQKCYLFSLTLRCILDQPVGSHFVSIGNYWCFLSSWEPHLSFMV